MLLLNAFSLNMVVEDDGRLVYRKISSDRAKELLSHKCESCIGHQQLANFLTEKWGFDIAFNRCTNALNPGDTFIVAQYKGPRLPEGATTLPEDAFKDIKFYRCHIESIEW